MREEDGQHDHRTGPRRPVPEQAIADRAGFRTFDAWFRARRAAGWSLTQMAAEAGITKQQLARRARRIEGPATSAERRLASRRLRFDAKARELGFDDLNAYLRAREGRSARSVAAELGTNHNMVRALREDGPQRRSR